MPKIFISYRREDASAYAGRLFDRLSAQYGSERIFMDIDSIEPGADFGEAIEQKVASCDVFIAVIGKRWLSIEDRTGARRLDNPDDLVRLEVASALARKIRVIPLLVGNAQMPRSDDLPETLKGLARRNAFEVSDIGFHENVTRLIQVLDRPGGTHLPPASAALPASAPTPAASGPVAVVKPGLLPSTIPSRQEESAESAPEAPAKRYAPMANSSSSAGTRSLGKAILLHLFLGFGLWYVKPQAKRKYVYPIAGGYALFDVIMAVIHVGPFTSYEFGARTFLVAITLFAIGFLDVAITYHSVTKKFR